MTASFAKLIRCPCGARYNVNDRTEVSTHSSCQIDAARRVGMVRFSRPRRPVRLALAIPRKPTPRG